MADQYVKAASAALCVAGTTCIDVIGKPPPANLQARQKIYDDLFDEKVERILGEPLRPLAIFGNLTKEQLEQRISVLEVIRFDAELEGKRLQTVPEAERTKEMSAIAEGTKHVFIFDLLELAQSDEARAASMKQLFEDERRLLMDPSTQIFLQTEKGSVRASDTITGKIKEFALSDTGMVVFGIGFVSLLWYLTKES